MIQAMSRFFLPNKSLPNAYVAVRYLGQSVIACRTQAPAALRCNKTEKMAARRRKRTSDGIKK
jgi:hypothetical protein